MPPKPLAEDLARKKAERDKQRKAQEALAVLEKPSGFEQAVNAVKDPVGTVKQLGRVAKETFYDPSKRFARAVDPNSGASPVERAAGLAETALYAADMLTPGVPEGSIARNLEREAMEKALDREVASYAASGRNAINHRTTLGIHGSPTEGLTEIAPLSRSMWSNLQTPEAWFWNPADNNFDARRIAEEVERYAGPDGQIYFARFPQESSHFGWVAQTGGQDPPVAWFSKKPGQVVQSTPGFMTKERVTADFDINRPQAFNNPGYARDFVAAFENAMTPAERRAFRAKQPHLAGLLAERKARYKPTVAPRQRFTEEELYALRPRPTLRQLQDRGASVVPLDTM